MAKKMVSNMKDLNKEINKLLMDVLKKQEGNIVADEIKRTQSDMVEQEVYAKYEPDSGEPWVYERRGEGGRRGEDGGLADVRNMWHETVENRGKVSMMIINMTPPNPEFNENNLGAGDLASLIELGDGGASGLNYYYKKNRSGDASKYLSGRPFQKETFNELMRNKIHVQTLAFALKQKGLNVWMM